MTGATELDQLHMRILTLLGRPYPGFSVPQDVALKNRLLSILRADMESPEEIARLVDEAVLAVAVPRTAGHLD